MAVHQSFLKDRVPSLPSSVHDVSRRLEAEGFEAWIVGESLLRLLLGVLPDAIELGSNVPVERALDLFPQAIPTDPRRGVVTVPAGGLPIDVSSFRRGALRDDLAHRDFTVLALAYRPATGALFDPSGGLRDLDARVLRCVGDAGARLAEDPLRMLRAARLVADYSFAWEPEIEAAIAELAETWKNIPAPRVRRELSRLLLASHPDAGLDLLRRTGVERRLARGARSDAGLLIASLPRDLPVRMAAWLRGTRPQALLRQLRFGVERSRQVERLLEHHPIDERVNPSRDRALSRLLRKLPPPHLEALFEMREWELEHDEGRTDLARARKGLAAVRNGLERIRLNQERSRRRTRMALDGRAVMELLGCGPGRRVGAALRFAAEWVAADPGRNEPDALRKALLEWDAQTADEAELTRRDPES